MADTENPPTDTGANGAPHTPPHAAVRAETGASVPEPPRGAADAADGRTAAHRCPYCGTATTGQAFSGGREWYCPGCDAIEEYDDPTPAERPPGPDTGHDGAAVDRSRRYLVPVARLPLPEHPDVIHLSVYEWLPTFEAWATGLALCGYSTRQGALPADTEITCANCLTYKPSYERILAGQSEPTPEQQLAEVRGLLSQWAPDLRATFPVLFRKLDDLLNLSQPVPAARPAPQETT